MPVMTCDRAGDCEITINLNREGDRPPRVCLDLGHAMHAVLMSWGWSESQLELMTMTVAPEAEPQHGRFTCTFAFGRPLAVDEYERLAAAAIGALCARRYVDGL